MSDDVTLEVVEEVVELIELVEKGDPGTTLPQNQIDALDAADSPSGANPYATVSQLGQGGAGLTVFESTPTQEQIDALQLTTEEGNPSSIKGPWIVDPAPFTGQPIIDSVVPGDQENVITFSPSPSTTPDSFNLYWSLTSGLAIGAMTQILGAVSPYTHTPLTNGVPVYYRLTQVVAAVESDPTAEEAGTPVATEIPFTWDAAAKGASIVLSAGDTTAAHPGTGWQSVKSTVFKNDLLRYFEIDVINSAGTYGPAIALMNAAAAVNTFPGADTNGIMFTTVDGNIYFNGSAVASGLGPVVGSATLTCAWDSVSGKIWFGLNATPNVAGAEHGTLAGPLSPSAGFLGKAVTVPTSVLKDTSDKWTYAPPAGYKSFGAP